MSNAKSILSPQDPDLSLRRFTSSVRCNKERMLGLGERTHPTVQMFAREVLSCQLPNLHVAVNTIWHERCLTLDVGISTGS